MSDEMSEDFKRRMLEAMGLAPDASEADFNARLAELEESRVGLTRITGTADPAEQIRRAHALKARAERIDAFPPFGRGPVETSRREAETERLGAAMAAMAHRQPMGKA